MTDRARCETCGRSGDVDDRIRLLGFQSSFQRPFSEKDPYECPNCLGYDITGLTPGSSARHGLDEDDTRMRKP